MNTETLGRVVGNFLTSEYPEISHVDVESDFTIEDITIKIYMKKGLTLEGDVKRLIREEIRAIYEILNPEENDSLFVYFVGKNEI